MRAVTDGPFLSGGVSPDRSVAPDRTVDHLVTDALAALAAYRPNDAGQQRLRESYRAHLRTQPGAVVKTGSPVHFTASCVVVDTTGDHVLLTHHRRARRWFQFGGHLEPGDAGVHAAATREVREESGVPDLTPASAIVELHRHDLAGDFGSCRTHLDIRYAASLPLDIELHPSFESIDVRWWAVDALPEGPASEVAGLVRAGLRVLGLR